MRFKILFAMLASISSPALAERLTLDHRSYPALSQAVMSARDDAIFYQDASPDFVLDRIMVRGRSASDWDEAIEMIVYPRGRKLSKLEDWYRGYTSAEQRSCPSRWTVIRQDEGGITFSRDRAQCADQSGQSRLYRAFMGKRHVFLVGGLYRGEMPEANKAQWLVVLDSARVVD